MTTYHPGRGARHIPGRSTPDSWVPMDGSFKQYTFSDGMDLQSAVPLDAQALLAAARQGAQSNAAEGWVQNLNTAALQSQLNTWQQRLKDHIDKQNGGNSTVADVLGGKNAQIDPLPYLAGTLPYKITARAQQFSEVPDSLRAQFRYRIYADARSAAWEDTPILHWQAPTASLAGKKLTLAWVPASDNDRQAIAALIPQGITDPAQLPRTIPASVRLKPQILLDGKVQVEGNALAAGSEPVGAGAFQTAGSGTWDQSTDPLIAGQQSAIGLSIHGLSSAQITRLKERMQATHATLQQAHNAPENQREAILQNITAEHLTGDLLTATIWGWFAAVQSHGAVAASQAQMFDRPALSYGLVHAQVRPNKLWGLIVTGITAQGLNLDIGHLRHIRWAKDDNPHSAINNKPELTQNGRTAAHTRWIAYNTLRGQYASAMEHAVLEQMWVEKNTCRYTDENGVVQNPVLADCAQGISAVKAIAIAQQQGQKIYTINQENRATALPKLPVGGNVGAEIRSAIEAGKTVTFHEKQVSAHGWAGYGFIIVDPETGAGAYLIEGKGNGGWLTYENVRELIYMVIGVLGGIAINIALMLRSILLNIAEMLIFGCPNGVLIVAMISVTLMSGAFVFLGLAVFSPSVIGIFLALVAGLALMKITEVTTDAWRRACRL